ncbi:MAG: DUF5685 family protein [Clostridia bacterium]|nr:DUF5685 family protein [Clostridia bacterium]
MFGYINPDKPYLFIKDETLYNALYCGTCKCIGKSCGQLARTSLTYDIAFTSAIVHNIKGEDVVIKKKRCGLHFIKRRPMALPDDTTIALACMNTTLAYYKLCDDALDGDKKGIFRFLYKRGYKRVLKTHPVIAEIISRQMENQRAIEEKGSSIIDEACEPTALMMQELSDYLLGEHANGYTRQLFYAIGKWIYLVDAVDDYDKDVKKGRYNVLYNAYGFKTFHDVLETDRAELNFIFDYEFAQMREAIAHIRFYFNHDLTDNIIMRGIPLKTRALFDKACPRCDQDCANCGEERQLARETDAEGAEYEQEKS